MFHGDNGLRRILRGIFPSPSSFPKEGQGLPGLPAASPTLLRIVTECSELTRRQLDDARGEAAEGNGTARGVELSGELEAMREEIQASVAVAGTQLEAFVGGHIRHSLGYLPVGGHEETDPETAGPELAAAWAEVERAKTEVTTRLYLLLERQVRLAFDAALAEAAHSLVDQVWRVEIDRILPPAGGQRPEIPPGSTAQRPLGAV